MQGVETDESQDNLSMTREGIRNRMQTYRTAYTGLQQLAAMEGRPYEALAWAEMSRGRSLREGYWEDEFTPGRLP